jgi:hypothetical protein
MNEKEYSWMNAWMHDNARIHGARFTMLELKVTPLGKDYGFKLHL